MTTYTNVFGGDTVPTSDQSYASYQIAASSSLIWPTSYSDTDLLIASFIDIDATLASLVLTLPPANEVSVGESIKLRNVGANSFEVKNASGASVVVVAPGEVKYLVVSNNATVAGSWITFTFGTGTSSADASALAGLGLQAAGGLIRTYLPYLAKSSNYQITINDRAKLINVTSGVVTLTLPQASTAENGFFTAIRNSGTGSVTLEGWGTEQVNGSLSYTINQNESLIVATDGASWYTVGQGKDATFAFSEFVVNAAAGNVTLSAADVAGRMVRIAGTAVGNITVTLPSIDNIYFVNTEAGLGGFSVTFTTGAGATLTLGANLRTVIYSDGTNIRTAVSTTVTSAISLDDGSDAAPSLTFALDSNLGLFRLGADQMGFTAGGTQVGFWDVNGWNGPAILTGTPTAPTAAAGTNTTQIATTAHVFAERSNTLTLTNKTFDLASNTLTGTKAQFDTALSNDNFGYLAEQNTWTAIQVFSGGSGGTEGGEISFLKPPVGSTLAGNILVDINTDSFRIFEAGGTGRGAFLNISACSALAGSRIAVTDFANTWTAEQVFGGGIDTPAATALPISIANVEQARITVAGSFGLGTTTPNYSSFTKAFTVEGSSTAGVELSSLAADGSGVPIGGYEWQFRNNSVNHQRVASILGVTDGATANQRGGSITFLTKLNGTTTFSEKARITSGGSFGVGTITPNYAGYSTAVTVEGTINAAFEISTTRVDADGALAGTLEWNFRSGAANHQRIAGIQGVTDGATATQRGGAVAVFTKPNGSTTLTERFRVAAAGHSIFTVPTNDGVRVTDGTREGRLIPSSSGAGSLAIVTPGAFGISFWTTNTERARFLSTGNLEILPYTKLGESSPAIKVKKLTGTTAATEGGIANIPHGVTRAKILGVQVIVDNTWGEASAFAEVYFSWSLSDTNIDIKNHDTNSGSILSKAVRILVTYEE